MNVRLRLTVLGLYGAGLGGADSASVPEIGVQFVNLGKGLRPNTLRCGCAAALFKL